MNATKLDKTILLVEDEAIISIITTKSLKKIGYDVITSGSGEKAVDIVSSNKAIHLILMDIDLGDGIDGTETARQILTFCDIPIVFHTSHSEREMVEKVKGITRYGYVVKSSGNFVLQSSIEMAFELFESHNSLQRSEANYALINNSSLDFIYSYDCSSRYTSANKKLCDVLNLSPEQIIGKSHSELGFSEALCEEWDAAHRIVFDTNSTLKTNTSILWSDGKVYIYEVILNPLHDKAGNIIGIGGISRDITERIKAEVELRRKKNELEDINEELNAMIKELESANKDLYHLNEELIKTHVKLENKREEYNILFESSSSAVFIIDEGRIKIMNSLVEKILGYPADIITSTHFTKFIHPEDRDITKDYYKRIQDGAKFEVDIQYRILTADDRVKWVNVKSVLVSMSGKVTTLNYANDITELVIAEKARAESEERYRQLFEHSPHGLVHFDTNGVIQKCNDVFVKIIGSSREKLLGLNMFSLPNRKMTEAIHDALNGEVSIYEDYYESYTARKTVFVKATIAPLKNASNELIGGVIIAEDSTEIKKIENELYNNKELFRQMFYQSKAKMMLFEPESLKILDANHAASKFYGYTIDELRNMYITDINISEIDKIKAERIHAVSEKLDCLIVQHKLANGEIRTVEVYGSTVMIERIPFLFSIIHDITERKEDEKRINVLLHEKELILKEVHHRIKNNMNTVASLLILQQDATKDPFTISALQAAEQRIRSMSILYNNLYISQNPKKLPINNYFSELLDDILSIFPNKEMVTVKKEIQNFHIDSKYLFALGIIINELITNTMKHAFHGRNEGVIVFTTLLREGNTYIIVQDDGKGLPESVELGKSKGFGLNLVSMMAEQIGCRITTERINGTKHILELQQ